MTTPVILTNQVVKIDETTIQLVQVDDAPARVIAIAEQGAAGVGVPDGGTTGQVLAKASDTDYDTEWVDILGGLSYQGSWNASTNTPALASSVGTNGFYYVVSVAGATNLNGITDWAVGDWAIFNGTIWQKIDNSEAPVLWGSITGTLSDQTDLQNALNAKQNAISISSPANGLSIADAILSLALASTSSTGALSATDWNTFNNKIDASALAPYALTSSLGTAAFTASTDYATAAQGMLADSALQSGDNVSELTNDAGYITSSSLTGYVPYTGATANVDLGAYDITASQATFTEGLNVNSPSGSIVLYGGAFSGTIDNIYIGEYAPSTGKFTEVHSPLVKASSSAGMLFESNSGTDVALFGAGGGAGATFYGGVTVAGQLAVDTNTLFVDATNNRVGIGTATPNAQLDVGGLYTVADATAINMANAVGMLTGNTNGVAGMMMGNTNTGTSADFRFAIRDTSATPAYLAFALPSANNNLTLFGSLRNTSGYVFMAFRNLTIGPTSAHALIFGTNNADRGRVTSDGIWGINTTAPSATFGGMDISSGGLSLILGANSNSTTRTNATDKLSRIGVYHYTNAEEPSAVMLTNITSSMAQLVIGGGTSVMNAMTEIRFFTATNTTTVTGTERAKIDSNGLTLSSRLQAFQGTDVASANNLVLGAGNVFEITGTTQINLISNLTWQNGSQVTLLFTSTPTVKHNQATSGTNITIQLAGAVDFVATAGDTLTLVLSEIGGTQAWREVSRAVI